MQSALSKALTQIIIQDEYQRNSKPMTAEKVSVDVKRAQNERKN
jgi:hypothetical protein